MPTFKSSYGTTNQTITISLNSLASSATAGRQSTVIDNRTNLFLDVLLAGQFTVPTGGTAAQDKAIYLYLAATADDTNYGAERGVAGTQATLGASDAAYSITDPTVGASPLILARVIGVPVSPTSTSGVYIFPPFSVASCFGGVMPAQWLAVVRNYSGITLHSSGNSLFYQGVLQQSV